MTFSSLSGRRYGAILADPPWTFKTYSAKGTGRGAVSHYDTMSFEDLAAMQVADLAADDCALFLWVPKTTLQRGLDLIATWGFTWKTIGYTWAKTTKDGTRFPIGLGYYTRANPEICLLATRGRPKRLSRGVPELIIAPRREHSRKPDEARERIEQLFAGPYLELFARDSRPGWDSWGAEVGLFDNGPVATRRQPSNLAGAV
jgi:N6-adenosine-specific RNA methylase IME4